MNIVDTEIDGVKLVEPRVFEDERGFFFECWNERVMADAGMVGPWVQDNHSRSSKGVLRGIHYQIERPQSKLVRVTNGAAIDVAIDLRRTSPTFGRYIIRELSAENKRMLWIPRGFGHAFLALADDTDVLYKCTDYFFPELERTIIWNDPDIDIEWSVLLRESPKISDKDARGTLLRDADVFP